MELTFAGWVVLNVGSFHHSDPKNATRIESYKDRLDALHKEKIALSQAIVVINVDGYIGESTRNEISYARALGKKVYWLDPDEQIRVKRDRSVKELEKNATTYTYSYDYDSETDGSWDVLTDDMET